MRDDTVGNSRCLRHFFQKEFLTALTSGVGFSRLPSVDCNGLSVSADSADLMNHTEMLTPVSISTRVPCSKG
jgi:hypothetical protein